MIKPALFGFAGTVSLLILYGVVMTLLSGWENATSQFKNLWYLMLPLSLGFGIQVGLFTHLKQKMKKVNSQILTTSSATSSAGMLACCTHHVTDVLPILGLSGISIFLARYQIPILTLSLGINLLGIVIMLKHLRKFQT